MPLSDGIAFQTYGHRSSHVERYGVRRCTELKVDGGASRNNLLMQFQANVLDIEVVRPKIPRQPRWAAYLAGLAVGYWNDVDEIKSQW